MFVDEVSKVILSNLELVAAERHKRRQDVLLAERVQSVKIFQHARFERTYADLLALSEYAPAARFFLDDLYGPKDFAERDAQFSRIVPALVRLFPDDIVNTVARLAELHALSESLDTKMGASVQSGAIDSVSYAQAWRAVGTPETRERQIRLMLEVGTALARFTRNPLLRHSLRLMRGPARAAGLSALQQFLETGFDTFRQLKAPAIFLELIAKRERHLAATLFDELPTPDINNA